MYFNKLWHLAIWAVTLIASIWSVSAYHVDFSTALDRMYDAWLTIYNTEASFRWSDSITRWEASKFTASFGGSQSLSNSYNKCTFSDISWYDSTLTPHISQACKYWLLKWSNGRFMPNNNLTYAQWVTLVIRALDGFQDESWAQRWSNYFAKANTHGIELEVSQNSANNINITREQLWLLFYQAYLVSQGKDVWSCDGTCDDSGISIWANVSANIWVSHGQYISYSEKSAWMLEADIKNGVYAGKNIIINFHASRCPTCNSLLKDIEANISDIPSNTVMLQADYDAETQLKKDYWVVRQTTFVYLDTNGSFVKKVETNRSMQNILDNL